MGWCSDMKVHFITIVLNGMPFITRHNNNFKSSGVPYHWHLVEGAAALVNDTAWSVVNGGHIADDFHESGLSVDGTSSYIDMLKAQDVNISVYRREGQLWNGKVEMMNAPLANIDPGDIVWQVDVDEFWHPEQISFLYQLYIDNPHVFHTSFYCNYYVGPRWLLVTRDGWGNNPVGEWRRVWRKIEGSYFQSHEPPVMVESINGELCDVALRGFIPNSQSEHLGLIFDHLGYVYKSQIRFKEKYYGYRNGVIQWLSLQNHTDDFCSLRTYLSWVDYDSRAVKVPDDIRAMWNLPLHE